MSFPILAPDNTLHPPSLSHISTWKKGRKPSLSNHPGIDVRKQTSLSNQSQIVFKAYWQKSYSGTGGASKTDEISEKFQTAFGPPPLIFGKSCCNFITKKPCLKVQYMQHNCLDRKCPHTFGNFRKLICFGIVTRPL